MGFSVAMSSVVARLIGAGRYVDMHRVLFHGFILVAGFGGLASFLGYHFAESIFTLMGASGPVLQGTLDYMYVWFAGAVFVSLPMIGNAAIRAAGNAKIPAYIMMFSALVNLILDPIFIFGLIGFPEMGMRGAALATIVSYVGGLVIGLYVMVFKLKILVNPAEFGWLKGFPDSAKRLVTIAAPASLTNAIQPLLSAIITTLLATSSLQAVAAYGIVTRVEAFLFVPIMAMASGMSPIIGQNFGAGQRDRVHDALSCTLKLAVQWAFVTAMILLVFGGLIAGLFTDDPEILKIARVYFWIIPLTYLLGNLLPIWSSAFNAMAKPQFSLAITITRMIILGIPACWIGAHLAGAYGVFIAVALVNIVAGSLIHLLSWRYAAGENRLIAPAE
jgi:putative MATE family efflux protein